MLVDPLLGGSLSSSHVQGRAASLMHEQLVQSTSPELRLPGVRLREESCQWLNVAQHDVIADTS